MIQYDANTIKRKNGKNDYCKVRSYKSENAQFDHRIWVD